MSKETLRSALLAVILTIAGTAWLFLRRGEVNLHIVNKAVAVTALLLIGITMVAPRSHRRSLGLTGAFCAILHSGASLLALADRFPWPGWFVDHAPSMGVALLASAMLLAMVAASFGMKWKRPLRWGLPLFVAGALHMASLKAPGWQL